MEPYFSKSGVTIYHGDALDVLPEIGAGTAGTVILDPPYSFESLSVRGRDDGAAGTSGSPVLLFHRTLLESYRILQDGGIVPMLCAWRRLPDVSYLSTLAGLRLCACVAWVKGNVGTGGLFRSSWDPVLVGSKGSPTLLDKSAVPNVINVSPVVGGEHPYEKPPELWVHFLRRIPSCVVVDPFAGLGASGVAAANCGHQWIGVEVSERFCEIAANRLRQDSLPLEVSA